MQKSRFGIAVILAMLFQVQASSLSARELRQNMLELRQARRLSQFSWAEDLKALRQKIVERIVSLPGSSREAILTAQAASSGDSYVSIVTYVTTENNTRSNLGLNNFTTDSVVKGPSPAANVSIGLFNPQGNLAGQGTKVVQSNQMLQVNNIIADLGGTSPSGWLLIFSDEPITAWASVIFNSSQDPSIELAIADQVYKPAGFVESQGTIYNPLMIQSSAKVGVFASSLVVANIGSGDGVLNIKIYDKDGGLMTTLPPVSIKANGMYINNDIRSTVAGSFGPIVISLDDPISDGKAPRIVAASIVKSDKDTSSFFPGFGLPQGNTKSIAGYYTGSLTGTLLNCQVEAYLYQERDMLYGTLAVKSGSFPLNEKSFLLSGEVINNKYLLQTQDAFDSDAPQTFFLLRLFGQFDSSVTINGDLIYFDEQSRKDIGSFTLTLQGAIFP